MVCCLPGEQEAVRRRFGEKARDMTYSASAIEPSATGPGHTTAFDAAGRAVGFQEKESLMSFEAVLRASKGTADQGLLSGAMAAAEEAVRPLYRELGRRFSDPKEPERNSIRKHLVDHLELAVRKVPGGGLVPEDAWLGPLWLFEFGGHDRSYVNLLRDFRRRWCFHFTEPPKHWLTVRGRKMLYGDSNTRALLESILPGAVIYPVRDTGTRLVHLKPDGLPPWESLKDAPGRELELIEAILHHAGPLPDKPDHPARVALVAAMTRCFYGFPGDIRWPWRRRLLDLLQQVPFFRKKGGGTASIHEVCGDNPDFQGSGENLDLNAAESALCAALWPEPEKGNKTRKRRRPRRETSELEGPTGALLAGAWGYLAALRGRPGLLSAADLLALIRETKGGALLLKSAQDENLRAAYLASVAATGLNRLEKRLTDQTDIDYQRDLARQLTAKSP